MQKTSVTELLDTLEEIAEDESDVTLGNVVETLGPRGFGPLILLPALLVITPLGGIPLFPTLMAIVIAILAVQVLMQRKHLWLPGPLRARGVEDGRLKKAVSKARPVGRWLDDHVGNRLEQLTGPWPEALAALVILVLCLCVPPSELIPFAAVLPMGAIGLLGLALSLRDGAVMLVGLLASGLALWGVYVWVF